MEELTLEVKMPECIKGKSNSTVNSAIFLHNFLKKGNKSQNKNIEFNQS